MPWSEYPCTESTVLQIPDGFLNVAGIYLVAAVQVDPPAPKAALNIAPDVCKNCLRENDGLNTRIKIPVEYVDHLRNGETRR